MKEEQTTRPWAVAVRMLLVIAVMASFVLASTAQAAQHDTEGRRVIPMGRTVGIKLFSDGVLVVGLCRTKQLEESVGKGRSGEV